MQLLLDVSNKGNKISRKKLQKVVTKIMKDIGAFPCHSSISHKYFHDYERFLREAFYRKGKARKATTEARNVSLNIWK